MKLTINKERVREIVNEFKERVEREADVLSLYVLAFGDVEYDSDGGADPQVKLTTLYQYLSDNITSFESDDFSLTSFDNFMDDLDYTDQAVYRYHKYNLKKIYPIVSYCDDAMGSSFLYSAIDRDSSRIAADDYLRSFSEYIVNIRQILKSEYEEAREERKNIIIITGNVNRALNSAMREMEEKCDVDEITGFYDFIYNQIQNYGKEDK